jgi:phage tail tape-measure protein
MEALMKDRMDGDTKKVERAAGANPDPITGEPGSHPVGTGVGSAGGAAAGAAVGAVVGGPVGAVVGGVAGAVIGGGAGHAAGEAANPTVEKQYWENFYKTRPYYKSGRTFDYYEPAYRYGWENATNPEFAKKSFDETESVLHQRWTAQPGAPTHQSWVDSKEPARDAWNRMRGSGLKA